MRRKVLTLILTVIITIYTIPVYTASAYSDGIKTREYFSAQDFVAPIPVDEWWKPISMPTENEALIFIRDNVLDNYTEIPMSVNTLKPVGNYYITAYCACSKCCWPSTNKTASGTTCHYESDPMQPTTCAIDRNIHHFGDIFYLKSEGRAYVAEDTGSAVKGKHIDLYFPDHSYVQSYGSHWETVYTLKEVELPTYQVIHYDDFNEFDISYRFDYYKRPNTQVLRNFCPLKITQNEELLRIEA